MAEAIGLALGVAGLVSVFKDCIDLVSIISAARSLGQDYELLNARLDIERTLLLQWAHRVRLLKPDHDVRLNDSTAHTAIGHILSSIRILLSQSDELKDRYGLKKVAVHDDTEALTLERTLSTSRMRDFSNAIKALESRMTSKRETVSIFRKFRWAVHDKEKFESLMRQLSDFIAKLGQVVPDVQNMSLTMTEHDVNTLVNPVKLRLIRDAARWPDSQLACVADEKIRAMCWERVLHSVWFRFMDERRDAVAQSHSETFQWALESPRHDAEWDSLSAWLSSGTGTYWISGKAGSGKSTLMKYILYQQKTLALLNAWADGCPLTVASFFFWRLGPSEQQTQEGLSRAILYNILNVEKPLIPTLLPNLWREAYDKDCVEPDPPSLQEMTFALNQLAQVAQERKFCFLIDGLDEYYGDYKQGIDTLKLLTTNLNIKVLVSSRPISACAAAFSSKPNLCLQDLTKNDISAYVYSTIQVHERMTTLMETNSKDTDRIISDLIERSSGVFLWVILACRSILDGFEASDDILDLRRRVEELPPELESMYQHIMGKIEPRYRKQAARLLRICFDFHAADGGTYGKLSTLGLATVESLDAEHNHISQVDDLNCQSRRMLCERLEGRLRSRCWGLLEIQRAHKDHGHYCFCKASPNAVHDTLVDSNVEFMHRSLFEFLSGDETWKLPVLHVDEAQFEAYFVLYNLSLSLIRPSLQESKLQAEVYFQDAAFFGRRIQQPLLIELAVSMLEAFVCWITTEDLQRYDLPPLIDRSIDTGKSITVVCLILIVQTPLVEFARAYVHLKMLDIASLDHEHRFLHHAIERRTVTYSLGHIEEDYDAMRIHVDMIEFLLLSGCDPQLLYSGHGRWVSALKGYVRKESSKGTFTGDDAIELGGLIKLLVEAGAFPESLEIGELERFISEPGEWLTLSPSTYLVLRRDLLPFLHSHRQRLDRHPPSSSRCIKRARDYHEEDDELWRQRSRHRLLPRSGPSHRRSQR